MGAALQPGILTDRRAAEGQETGLPPVFKGHCHGSAILNQPKIMHHAPGLHDVYRFEKTRHGW